MFRLHREGKNRPRTRIRRERESHTASRRERETEKNITKDNIFFFLLLLPRGKPKLKRRNCWIRNLAREEIHGLYVVRDLLFPWEIGFVIFIWSLEKEKVLVCSSFANPRREKLIIDWWLCALALCSSCSTSNSGTLACFFTLLLEP